MEQGEEVQPAQGVGYDLTIVYLCGHRITDLRVEPFYGGVEPQDMGQGPVDGLLACSFHFRHPGDQFIPAFNRLPEACKAGFTADNMLDFWLGFHIGLPPVGENLGSVWNTVLPGLWFIPW